MKKKVISLCILILLFTTACTNTKAAPDLSIELGNRLSLLEKAHLISLHKYFDLKRELVDEYIKKEWIPLYAKNFFSIPQVDKDWKEIIKIGQTTSDEKSLEEKRLTFIIDAATDIQLELNNTRNEMLQVINELEIQARENIEKNYKEADELNNAITRYLIAESNLSESKNDILNKIGLENKDFSKIIEETEKITSTISNNSEKSLNKANEFIKKYEEFKGDK